MIHLVSYLRGVMQTVSKMKLTAIALVVIHLALCVRSSTTNYRISRQKRHAFTHGNCQPLITDLAQGLRILHETHIRRETFYFKPRSTFTKIMLQMRLDNTLVQTPPKIYNARVEYTAEDLGRSNISRDKWIPVHTELYKDKQLLYDHFILKLTVGNVSREAVLQKYKFFYVFESLVFWGQGGAEWSFDCHPHLGGSSHGVSDEMSFDWWMLIAVVVIVIMLGLLVMVCCACAVQRCCRGSKTSKSIARVMSWKKQRNNLEDPIYAELSVTSLQNLQRRFADMGVEGFTLPPAPRTAPASVRHAPASARQGGVTVARQPIGLCEVEDTDWFGTLENCSTNRNNSCEANQHRGADSCYSVPRSHTARPENNYSQDPLANRATSGDYLDMTKHQFKSM